MNISELNKVITSVLNNIEGATYHDDVPDDASFPYKVYSCEQIDFGNLDRYDMAVTIDIWDRNSDSSVTVKIADEICEVFNNKLHNTSSLLSVAYMNNRMHFKPEDGLQHEQLEFVLNTHIRR